MAAVDKAWAAIGLLQIWIGISREIPIVVLLGAVTTVLALVQRRYL